jgi:excisionase family DNA binding protein
VTPTPIVMKAKEHPAPKLITLKTAASRYEGVSTLQLRVLIARGQLPAVRPGGSRAYLVSLEDVDRLFTPTLRGERHPDEARA